jgi:cell division FtsZ-interacting protein ZapD
LPQGNPDASLSHLALREYVELVDSMGFGHYSRDELRELDSQRQVTHNQLLDITGLDRSEDMYAYAKAVLLAAQGGNIQ